MKPAGRSRHPPAGIAADSLAPKEVGALMFPIAKAYVDEAVLVRDHDIARAQALLWNNYRIASEAGGAAALAAITSGAYRPDNGEKVGVIVCGANVDLAKLQALALRYA